MLSLDLKAEILKNKAFPTVFHNGGLSLKIFLVFPAFQVGSSRIN